MPGRTPVAEQPLVGDGTTATAWTAARERLENPEEGRTYWLDDAFYFLPGATTRRGRNLSHDPRGVVTTSSTALPALDLIVEGRCREVGDDATLHRVAEAYGATMDWPLEVRDGAVYGPSAPTAGPPPYAVYELVPEKVIG